MQKQRRVYEISKRVPKLCAIAGLNDTVKDKALSIVPVVVPDLKKIPYDIAAMGIIYYAVRFLGIDKFREDIVWSWHKYVRHTIDSLRTSPINPKGDNELYWQYRSKLDIKNYLHPRDVIPIYEVCCQKLGTPKRPDYNDLYGKKLHTILEQNNISDNDVIDSAHKIISRLLANNAYSNIKLLLAVAIILGTRAKGYKLSIKEVANQLDLSAASVRNKISQINKVPDVLPII